MKKRAVALFLALIFASAALCACGTGKIDFSDSTGAGTLPGSSTGNRYDPNVPVYDCDGFRFVILNSLNNEGAALNYIYVDYSDKLDSVSDAAYRRNRYIEELYNIEFSEIEASSPEISTRVAASINAGTDDYSLVNVIGNVIYSMAADGLLYKLNAMPYVNLEAPWWTKGSVEGYSIGGNLYYATSDLTLADDEYTAIIMYNQFVAEKYNLKTPDEMYKLVADGDWTWDVMFSLAKKVADGGDNGDSVINFGDDLGILVCDWAYIAMMHSAGEVFTKKDENDIPYINYDSQSFVDKFTTLVNKTQDVRTFVNPGDVTGDDSFRSNHALMIMQVIAHVRISRDMESDFAVLPMPKYNDEQDKYYSYVTRSAYLAVPYSIGDPDMIGMIIEAWTAKSSEIVIPDYYDVALSERFMRDEGSKAMVNYIYNGTIYDPLVSTLCWDNVFGMFSSMGAKRANYISSLTRRYGSYIEKKIQESVDAFRELDSRYD